MLVEPLRAGIGAVVDVDAEEPLEQPAAVALAEVQILGGELFADAGLDAVAPGMGEQRGIGGRNPGGRRAAAERGIGVGTGVGIDQVAAAGRRLGSAL
jgi:hypothetical protein